MTASIGFDNGVLNSFIQAGQFVHRFGFDYSSSVFTLKNANGRDLSDNNPAYASISSKANRGQFVNFRINSNFSFEDASGTSEITGMLFGVTTGVAWNVDLPFHVYLVMNDSEDTLQAMLSRNPYATQSPAAASIGTPSTPITVSENDFFSFDDITVGDFDNNPCVYVGCIRMRKTGVADDWTVQTLSDIDGVGKDYDGTTFQFPQGQNGADAGKWFSDGGAGTAVGIGGSYNYKFYRDGSCYVNFSGAGPVTTTAAGGQCRLHIPIGIGLGDNISPPGHFAFLQNASATYLNFLGWRQSASTPKYLFLIADGGVPVVSSFFAAADTNFSGTFRYATIFI